MLDEIIAIAKGFCQEDIQWGADTSVLTDMELTSLEIFELIGQVEDRFSVRLTDRQLRNIVTLGDIADAVKEKRSGK